jgi:hypothetical protein
MTTANFIMPGDGPDDSPVEVVLRPDPQAALANPEISTYWGGEVVIKNVQLDSALRVAVPGGFGSGSGSGSGSGGFGSSSSVSSGSTIEDLMKRRRLQEGSSSDNDKTTPASARAVGGVLLKLETRRAGNGPATAPGDDATNTRELLVFPNTPFMQRITGEDGVTTTISGLLKPGNDARHFSFEMEYSKSSKDGGTQVQERFSSPSNMALGKALPFGRTKGSSVTITLTLPPPAK